MFENDLFAFSQMRKIGVFKLKAVSLPEAVSSTRILFNIHVLRHFKSWPNLHNIEITTEVVEEEACILNIRIVKVLNHSCITMQ